MNNLNPSTCHLPLPLCITAFLSISLPSPHHRKTSIIQLHSMATKGRSQPRIVCCAIPIARAAGKVLVVTSRKRPDNWVCESSFLHMLCNIHTYPTNPHPASVFVNGCVSSDHRPFSITHLRMLADRPFPFLSIYTESSAQRRLGTDGWRAGGSSLARSLGRRSHPLSLYPSPPILTYPLPRRVVLAPCNRHIALHHPCALSLSTAGVRGSITRFVTTIPTASSTYHFYELDVAALDQDWLESGERRREWVDYAEAVRRVSWKTELAQGLMLSSLAPRR